MAYFNVCEFCGASLDPGEKCDCKEEKERSYIIGVDMASGKDKTVIYNPDTNEREII